MDIPTVISAEDLVDLTRRVDTYNKALSGTRSVKNFLGKDDFLKILLTQLTHQDPTQPLKDSDFVAQMAQFSSLEQMSNMNRELGKVINLLAKSQAVSLLGKSVKIVEGNEQIIGIVEEVAGGDFPQILVNGRFYDVFNVESVKKE